MKKTFLLFILISSYFYSQYKKTDTIFRKDIIAKQILHPPKIDGILDDIVWQDIPTAGDFLELDPINGQKAPYEFRSEVKIGYDDLGIYIAAHLFDPNPKNIQKQLTERDKFGNFDFFAVILNGFNDKQQAFQFIVSAAGVQMDLKSDNDSGEDSSWNAVWDSAVKITPDGWVVEMKIPYFELRFPKKESQIWGINFVRSIKKTNTRYTWNFVDNRKGNLTLYDGTLSGIQNINPPTRLSFLPYFSSYINHYNNETQAIANGGMDLKYGINDAFTLDMTLIPDFGQANYDNVILNLGPFEQYLQENRSFFTEGTELFNKGNLFYSRRVGGYPTKQATPNDNEKIIENPEKVKLLNAFKISGRTEKGLGIGIFNGITEKTEATIKNITSGTTRKETIEPIANYNVLVLDKRFRGNSSFSFVNTNVTRNRDFRDANVSALMLDLTNKKNTFNVYGNIKQSIVNDKETVVGTEANFGMGKTSGAGRYSVYSTIRNKNYNIDDLGYTGGNNYWSYGLNYNFRFLKPRGLLNNLFYNVNINFSQRLTPFLFNDFRIHQNLSLTDRNFKNFGMGLLLEPFGTKDIFEPRTFGKHLNVPEMINPWFFYNSDQRKKFYIGGYTEIYVHNESGRIRYVTDANFRYRISDKLSFNYNFNYDLFRNNIGFAGKSAENIWMGRRNIDSFENSLSSEFTFNGKMNFQLSFRHYVSSVAYNQFYTLNDDGSLSPYSFLDGKNNTYNFWNFDLRYSWWFAPGSQITLLYRNAVDRFTEVAQTDYKKNLDDIFSQPTFHNFSIKITYFLDYNRLKNWVK